MKKQLRAFALVISLLLLVPTFFTGCHGAGKITDFQVPENFDESKNYEITFWAKNDTNKAQTDIYKQTVRNFEELYPNIKVNMKLYTDYTKIYNDVITNISTETTPNVCITYPDHIATYLTGQNVVVPLNSLFDDEKYGLAGSELRFESPAFEELVPQYIDECKIGENYYAVPFMRSTEACYINKDYVEKLGYSLPDVLTWDFIWEVSEAAMRTDADGNYLLNGEKVMIPFIYKSTDNMMITMLKQKQADYSTENGDILLFNDTTTEILKTVAEHAGTRAFSTFKISGYPANFLNAGESVFAVDSTAGATWMGADAPLSDICSDKVVDYEIAVRPVPQYDVENMYMMSQGPSVCIFNKNDSGEVLASWLFAQYLLSNDVQISYSETEGYVPVTLKAQNAEEYRIYLSSAGKDNAQFYRVKIQVAQMLLENADKTFVTPVFNGSASLRNAAGQVVENTVKSMRRKETVNDAYFTKMYSEVSSLYRLDGFSAGVSTGKDLGPLPLTAKLLLGVICATWMIIGLYSLVNLIKKRKSSK